MGICVSCRRRDRKAPEKRETGAGGAAGGRGPAKGAAAELLPRRADPVMANSISNIKMTNPIKGIVSKRRKRYIKDGFNLDLTYITDRLIAMGFPAEKLEAVYRNHIDEVYRFLENKHQNHYKIYNLCSERSYDSSKFHDRVVRYAFDDHTPPKMELIQPFCEDVDKWLKEDPRNVAAVHCKAGKGRTGTMVCCYLLYSGQKATADEALKFYGTKRTHDEKGVTIPSQRRYVEYYEALVRNRPALPYAASKLLVRELLMRPPPQLNGGQAQLELTVSQAHPPLKLGGCCAEVKRHESTARLALDQCVLLAGDVRVDVFAKPKMMMRKEKLFHFWFNTFFVANCVGAVPVSSPDDSMNLETFKLTLNKWQLDDAHKDKQHKLYSPDFKVELIVQKPPASSTFTGQGARAASPASSSASSGSEPDTEPDAHWDSGESTYL
ncbi:phosphatidylinositol 3,4,5-trisphosphate 3-phosphatase and dual-specificity protein phosphatase PTEN isoform X2 [Hyposmocoma kahamanoa]|uniref:phosphatidylinositol 3,4,5-trisphosphate 3-phosphatase and dual-specificity protein phosphatase PTEN isoform X2 n=1 Tax=Hyposmocoma kahamanoa TaxID=1477025 RepID=UPI000E6D5FD5|nr:phosphatidylinositol 3,4,5-trisphosphate 3-phosphatase and dual-specificity protein phosphatase PTEN isoform X2 [Hyposmocoma kahamanoa]